MLTLGNALRLIPVTLVMGIIFFLSHQPATELALPPITGVDKLAHAVAYAVLAASLLYGLEPVMRHRHKPRVTGLVVVVLCLAYGMTDELHQSFIPGRVPSLADLVADGTGAALLVLAWLRLWPGRPGQTVS